MSHSYPVLHELSSGIEDLSWSTSSGIYHTMQSNRKRKSPGLLKPEFLNFQSSTSTNQGIETPRRFFIIGMDGEEDVDEQTRRPTGPSTTKRPRIQVVESSTQGDTTHVDDESNATLSASQRGIIHRRPVGEQDQWEVVGENTTSRRTGEDTSNSDSESDLDSDCDTASSSSELDFTSSSTSGSDSDEEASSSGGAQRTSHQTRPEHTKMNSESASNHNSADEERPSKSLLSRLQEFMPLLKASNDALFAPNALDRDAVSMEQLTGTEEQLIEIDLGLGVLEHRSDEYTSDSSTSDNGEAQGVNAEDERMSRGEVLARLKGESDSTARRAMIEEVGS